MINNDDCLPRRYFELKDLYHGFSRNAISKMIRDALRNCELPFFPRVSPGSMDRYLYIISISIPAYQIELRSDIG